MASEKVATRTEAGETQGVTRQIVERRFQRDQTPADGPGGDLAGWLRFRFRRGEQ